MNNTIIPITNTSGQIALRHHPLSATEIFIDGLTSGRQYVARTEAGICLVWVEPEDVEQVLQKKIGCCNNRRQAFDYANEQAVRIWTNKGGS